MLRGMKKLKLLGSLSAMLVLLLTVSGVDARGGDGAVSTLR